MDNNEYAINLEGVTKKYGPDRGVFNVNLKIKKGEAFGLIGPSGAGKTTLLRIILGFIKAQDGTVEVNGSKVWNNTQVTNANVSYVAGEPIIPNAGTGLNFLKWYAKFRGIKDTTRMYELIQYFELDAKVRIKKMSKGMKQRVAIIAALMGDFDIYYFDEPTSGLDPVMREKFINMVIDLKAQGKTIFLSSHMMDEIQKICDQVVILKKGQIKFDKSVSQINRNKETITNIFWDVYKDVDRHFEGDKRKHA